MSSFYLKFSLPLIKIILTTSLAKSLQTCNNPLIVDNSLLRTVLLVLWRPKCIECKLHKKDKKYFQKHRQKARALYCITCFLYIHLLLHLKKHSLKYCEHKRTQTMILHEFCSDMRLRMLTAGFAVWKILNSHEGQRSGRCLLKAN